MVIKKQISKNGFVPGTHIIAEFFGCQNIESLAFVRRVLREAARLAGARIVYSRFHKFYPQGLTGFLLLAESHISIHTWPEHNYVAVDVFTCSSKMKPMAAIKYLRESFQVKRVKYKKIKRGTLL